MGNHWLFRVPRVYTRLFCDALNHIGGPQVCVPIIDSVLSVGTLNIRVYEAIILYNHK